MSEETEGQEAEGDRHLDAMGMAVVSASADEVVIEWQVGSKHHQPMGIVHGGVHCSAIESACSIGASISAMERDAGKVAVGLENQTSFIRAVREGKLRAVATPLTRGRRSQLWQCEVRDEAQQLIASGRVRLMVVDVDAPIGNGPG